MAKKHKSKSPQLRQIKSNLIETHWEKIIIILLLILPLIYFASFLNPDKMIAGGDYLNGGYPFEKWTAEQNEMPLWYPHVVGGIPVLGSPVGGPLAPLAQLREIIPPQVVFALTFIIFFFLAGLGTYLYLKEIGLSPYTAAIGAVVYQFIGNLATTPNDGHVGRAASIAMFPLMLFFVHRALKSKKILYFILTSFATTFAFYEGHFQMTYYGLLFILGYVIYYLVIYRKENTTRDIIKIVGYGSCAIALICLLMAALWLPVLGGLGTAARGVERGYEYATSWAMPPNELIDLVIPTYSGSLDNYWGLNSFKHHHEYFGLLSIIFAIFTILLFWKKPYVRFYTLKIVVILFVALGGYTPVFRVFYTIIPGFRLFRVPSMVFYLISFGSIVLGAIGFENIFVRKREGKENDVFRKKFYVIAGILLAIFVIVGIVCTAGRNSIIQSMQERFVSQLTSDHGSQVAQVKLSKISENFPEFIRGIWRTLVFVIVILAIIYMSIRQRGKAWIFAITAIAITLVDQLPLVAKYLPSAPAPRIYYADDDVVRFIKKDTGVFRVFPTPLYEHSTDLYLLYHNIQSAGGYIPNPIKRYQEFIGADTSVLFKPSHFIRYPKFLDILNVKYLISSTLPDDISQYDIRMQMTIENMKKYFSRFTLIYRGRRLSVYLNDSVLPRAYIVSDYQTLEGSEVLSEMQSGEFDPRQIVILEQDPQTPHPKEKFAYVEAKIVSYTANNIMCITECLHPGFLVLTDNWHPDWKVFVDGKKDKLYRANYTFRAVYLNQGRHKVVFSYISRYFNLGKIISIITFILTIVVCVLLIVPKDISLKR